MIVSIYPVEDTAYPEYLSNNGLTEDMLLQLLFNEENNQIDWTIPETCASAIFFSNLHPFLQTSIKTKVCTKSRIGQLYCEIDPFMAARNFRPDNAFRYVDRLVKRSKSILGSQSDLNPIAPTIIAGEISVDDSTVGTCSPPHVSGCTSNWSPDVGRSRVNQEEPAYHRRNVIRREYRKKGKIESLKLKIKQKDADLRKMQKTVTKGYKMVNVLSEKLTAVTA